MKKTIFIMLMFAGILVVLSGCCSCGTDGVKSETYSKETAKTQQIVIE